MEERGQPRTFKTAEEFENKFIEYVELCKTRKDLPNIAGFCVYAHINRDTFYAQKDYYSDTYKRVNEYLEDATINSKDINDTFKIFYMKNKFNYRDRQEIDAEVKQTNITIGLED